MSTIIQGDELRNLLLGRKPISKAYTMAVETASLFTIAGGLVLVTSLVGKVTTAVTTAGTTKLQMNPTTGDTADLCQATDLGTTDTAAGDVLGFLYDQDGTTNTPVIARYGQALSGIVLPVGDIEIVNATGADGAITWYLTYVPYDDGATVVAA
jgi:hypothetical protein